MYWGVMGGIEERWRKGPWTAEEDRLLIHHVNLHGEGRWNSVATLAGLKRNGKSCRLRWVNYLRPDLKRGRITPHEETIILDLHARWGNRWSTIARSLPGRTDNEIKNYWRTHFKKKSKVALDESAKLKIRELKRQKFQLEQRQLQLQRLEMQQNITDIKKMMLFLEESEGTVKAYEERQSMILSNGCSSQEISMGEDFERCMDSHVFWTRRIEGRFDIWRHKGLRNQLVMYWGVMGGIEERWRKGPWTAEEDRLLIHHVNLHGEGRWNSVATLAGLKRNGKSCRLRWVNYLRPDLKRGRITPHEETIILDLHARWGNRWSTIARSLPGRTDNEIKNYWRTHFKKKSKVALDETAKLKIQELKRQKFQQEHRQLQSQQLEMQQKITDIKKMMLFLEESEGSVKANEERQSMILSNGYNYAQEISMGEDFGLWESLWNLDDVHGPNFHAAKAS